MVGMKNTVFGLVLAMGLAGCGSSSDVEVQTVSNPGAITPQLSGTVRSEAGGLVSGVRVVAQERTTRQEWEVVSGADGRFAVNLPAGTYDVGLDLEGDASTATTFYGPLTVGTRLQKELVLHSAQGHATSELFGRIFLRPGIPAAGRNVAAVIGAELGQDQAGTTAPVTATTSTDGSFSLNLPTSNEVAVDVEVYDANNALDEFIDISKRDKACYVEFVTEDSNVENTLRANQSELTSGALPQVRAQSTGVTPFTIAFQSGTSFTLSNGLIPVEATSASIPQLSSNFPAPADQTNFQGNLVNWSVYIGTNGSWWHKYAANVFVNLPATWYFTDQNNTTNKLSVSGYDVSLGGAAKVSYNSSKPNIQAIRVTD